MTFLINLCLMVLVLLVVLWLMNIVLARLSLPDDIKNIVQVIIALVVLFTMLGWLGVIPGLHISSPVVVLRQ